MKKLPRISELEECPYCGATGYYVPIKISGNAHAWYNFDGSEADNSEMFSSIGMREMAFAFCETCHKKIARTNKGSIA